MVRPRWRWRRRTASLPLLDSLLLVSLLLGSLLLGLLLSSGSESPWFRLRLFRELLFFFFFFFFLPEAASLLDPSLESSLFFFFFFFFFFLLESASLLDPSLVSSLPLRLEFAEFRFRLVFLRFFFFRLLLPEASESEELELELDERSEELLETDEFWFESFPLDSVSEDFGSLLGS